jgi:hypothetical protein
VDYKELLKQFEEASQDKSVKHIEEVIDIDVQRSFNNHSNCDPIVSNRYSVIIVRCLNSC